MQIKNFEELEIWKEARSLTREIYTLAKSPQFSKDYGTFGTAGIFGTVSFLTT